MSNLYPCPTLVVPELEVKSSLRLSTVPTRSTHTPVMDTRCSSRRRSPSSIGVLPPLGARNERNPKLHAVSCWRSCCRARFYPFPRYFPHFSNTYVIRCIRPFPPPIVYAARGRLSEQCAIAITIGTLHEAVLSMGGCRSKTWIGAPSTKYVGYGHI
jgi:hypothetical protein